MKILRVLTTLLSDRYFPLAVGVLGLLIVIGAPERISDLTHEIQFVGSSWFRGTAIPILDTYSHFGPFVLYLGAWYDKIITTTLLARIADIAYFSTLAYAFYTWLKLLHPKDILYRNTLLLLGVLLLSVPGVWQLGITPLKVSMLALVVLNFCFLKWRDSGESYWVFGKTAKNWRYMLACGVALSILLYSSLLFSLFAIPFIFGLIRSFRKELETTLRHSLLLIVPILVHSWVWYSFFASRHLLGEALKASALDFSLTTHGLVLSSDHKLALIAPLITILVLALICLKADNFKKDRHTWITGLAMIEALVVSRSGILYTLPLLLVLFAPIYVKRVKPEYFAGWLIFSILLVLPYRAVDSARASTERIQATLTTTYLTQRDELTTMVLYYGRGAGYYELSQLAPSTRYVDTSILLHDTNSLALGDKFRGDNEASSPTFIVYATSPTQSVGNIPRLEEYFTKHYDQYAQLDGYLVLRRKEN